MFTPGQLIRHQRHRRAWTQRELASLAGIPQSQLASYEAGVREPTWPVLCRILVTMGLQPRVVAESIDISQYKCTAAVRRDGAPYGPPPGLPERQHPPIGSAEQRLQLAELMRADVSARPPALLDLAPIAHTLDGLPYVIVGPAALRLHGLPCTVPYIEAVVALLPHSAPPTDHSGGACDMLFTSLTKQARSAQSLIWSPRAGRYLGCRAEDR